MVVNETIDIDLDRVDALIADEEAKLEPKHRASIAYREVAERTIAGGVASSWQASPPHAICQSCAGVLSQWAWRALTWRNFRSRLSKRLSTEALLWFPTPSCVMAAVLSGPASRTFARAHRT